MTDAKQPDKFDWATELSDAQGHVTLSAKEAHEIGARLRSMGAENETLRAALAAAPTTQPAPSVELGVLQAEIAGHEAANLHLSAMVDELRELLQDAKRAMTELHQAAIPDESAEGVPAIIPPDAFRAFVDAHAKLCFCLHQRGHNPVQDAQQPAPQPSPTPQADSQPVRDERDDFEKVFPLPSGCIRVGTGYASTGYSNWAAHTHRERWQGWQARAAQEGGE